MFEERLTQLEQRLAAAERELRRLRQQRRLMGGAALLAVLGISGLVAVTTSTAQGPDKGHTVKAPFVVVDAAGKPIMGIGTKGHRRLTLHDSSGAEVVGMGESEEGKGSATLLVGTDKNTIGLQNETGDNKGGFFYKTNGKVTVRLGEMGLGIYDDGSKRIVQVSADKSGQVGEIQIGKAGNSLVQLKMDGDAGRVMLWDGSKDIMVNLGKLGIEVFNKGKGVAHLGRFSEGNAAGYLSIGNQDGSAIVEAGMLDGAGMVRALPLSGQSPIPIPNFIRGGKSAK